MFFATFYTGVFLVGVGGVASQYTKKEEDLDLADFVSFFGFVLVVLSILIGGVL